MSDYYSSNWNQNSGTQSYSSNQYQQQQTGFNYNAAPGVSTNMPAYNVQKAYYQGAENTQYYNKSSAQSKNYEPPPPPSYDESHKDRLLRKGSTSNTYPSKGNLAADDKKENPQLSLKKDFSSCFDMPGKMVAKTNFSSWSTNCNSPSLNLKKDLSSCFDMPAQSKDSKDWFSNNYSSSQDYKQNVQGSKSIIKPHEPISNLTSGYRSEGNRNPFNNNQRSVGKSNTSLTRGSERYETYKNYQGGERANEVTKNYQGRERANEVTRNFKEKTLPHASYNQKHDVFTRDSYRDRFIEDSQPRVSRTAEQQRMWHDGLGVGETTNRMSTTDYDSYRFIDADEQMPESDNDEGYQATVVKVGRFIPDSLLVSKYEFYPPTPEEMGEMFGDLVIYFFYKVPKNKKEDNPFVVICESFRRSERYSSLQVEDGYDMQNKWRKFCTLRYERMMMSRGVGENSNLKEPRVLAGVDLINSLAMVCYTLKAKPMYFSKNQFDAMLEKEHVPGVYMIVPKREASDFDSARKFLETKVSSYESDTEYIFNIKECVLLKRWAMKETEIFDARIIKDQWVGISRRRSPQYWRDKMLASGVWENEKYCLIPPRGIGNLHFRKFNILNHVRFSKYVPYNEGSGLPNLYGPPGTGPKISKAIVPWDRKRGKDKKRKKKIKRQINLEKKRQNKMSKGLGQKKLIPNAVAQ